MTMQIEIITIAKVCHEANRAYCQTLGDESQAEWNLAPSWQRKSAMNGVWFHLENPNATPSASHDKWRTEKVGAGWKHGKVKDEGAKTHPCIVDFDQLPIQQQRKDVLFAAIVGALS